MNAIYWIAVAAVTVISAARLTRLAVYDHFPPTRWVRNKFLDATDGSNWQLLGLCGYCFSFWATVLVVVCGDLAGVYDGEPWHEWMTPAWWYLFGALAASYLAAMFVANDGDNSEDED